MTNSEIGDDRISLTVDHALHPTEYWPMIEAGNFFIILSKDSRPEDAELVMDYIRDCGVVRQGLRHGFECVEGVLNKDLGLQSLEDDFGEKSLKQL